jgi:hypothetical protein
MIKRQHVVNDFFFDADVMRAALDARFKDAYTEGIPWFYFCDPRIYTYLRAAPDKVFPGVILDRFMQRLRNWCMDNLGLAPMGTPYLHLMVNGCRLGLHSDYHNGTWGYVYSLTRWEERKFSGGETLLMRDGVPSYKKHHVHGEVLYELVPAVFNQLLIFDDRIVHATPTVEGSMDPMEGRIAMVGHIRATSPVVTGSLQWSSARKVVLSALFTLRDRVRSYKEVQGTMSLRLDVSDAGAVESLTVLTDNLITQSSGFGASDAVAAVKSIIQNTMAGLKFEAAAGSSTVIVPVLVPLPDLQPIKLTVGHSLACEYVQESLNAHLRDGNGLKLAGTWDERTLLVREPTAGSITIEADQVSASFDPPMWVPLQREKFQMDVTRWINSSLKIQ